MNLVLERSRVLAKCRPSLGLISLALVTALPFISSLATNYKTLNCGSRRKSWGELGSVCLALKLPSSIAES